MSKPSIELISDLLTRVATGDLEVGDALSRLSKFTASEEPSHVAPDHLTLDVDRERRCGFPEVIYGQGKSVDLILDIIRRQQDIKQNSLVTRIDPTAADVVSTQFSRSRFNPIARTVSVGFEKMLEPAPVVRDSIPHAAVVSAGSTDAPAAEEAIETLAWMGIPVQVFHDIGVAGPQRLLDAVPRLRSASAVVVVAGMEGALPAAIGGHLDAPVFAVPTSVGYGATLGGLTPLLGMLSSCASNVAVVNIDAGFKAGYLAGLVTSKSKPQSDL